MYFGRHTVWNCFQSYFIPWEHDFETGRVFWSSWNSPNDLLSSHNHPVLTRCVRQLKLITVSRWLNCHSQASVTKTKAGEGVLWCYSWKTCDFSLHFYHLLSNGLNKSKLHFVANTRCSNEDFHTKCCFRLSCCLLLEYVNFKQKDATRYMYKAFH